MRIVRFRPEHLGQLKLQVEQQAMRDVIDRPEYGAALSLAGPSFTAMVGQHPVACLGVQECAPHRAEAWALLGIDSGPHLRAITKAVRGWLQQTSYLRVEASVSVSFVAGHRWAMLLGLEQEGPPRRAFMPDGGDGITYTRIQHGGSDSIHDDGLGGSQRDRRHQPG